jgi:hypothetical protein
MSTYKNTSGDLTLTGDNGLATLTINYANTVFNGNVIYTVPAVTDFAFLTVAANNTGGITDGGLLMQRIPGSFAGLRFDTTANTWQVSPSVTALGIPVAAYSNITTGAAGSTGAIQFNQNGEFGGSNNLLFDSGNSYIYANTAQYIGYQPTPPNVANTVAIYSNAIGSGGTGLYFTSNDAADELVSKSTAIVFAIIF